MFLYLTRKTEVMKTTTKVITNWGDFRPTPGYDNYHKN